MIGICSGYPTFLDSVSSRCKIGTKTKIVINFKDLTVMHRISLADTESNDSTLLQPSKLRITSLFSHDSLCLFALPVIASPWFVASRLIHFKLEIEAFQLLWCAQCAPAAAFSAMKCCTASYGAQKIIKCLPEAVNSSWGWELWKDDLLQRATSYDTA